MKILYFRTNLKFFYWFIHFVLFLKKKITVSPIKLANDHVFAVLYQKKKLTSLHIFLMRRKKYSKIFCDS